MARGKLCFLTILKPCTLGELGDEGTVLDKLESGDNTQFYIVELPTKQDIVTVPEEWIVNVDLN